MITRRLASMGRLAMVLSIAMIAADVSAATEDELLEIEEEDLSAAGEADEVAKALTNPNATLGFLTFSLDRIAYGGSLPGAEAQDAWKLNFQPSLPYSLSEDMNLFVRPLIPVVLDQPVPVVADQAVLRDAGIQDFTSRGVELGDIGMDVAVGKTLPGGTVLFGGVVATFPTATDDSLGLDQYLMGPEFYIGKVWDWGAVGLLLTHQWDIAGEDSFDTSITGGQYFFTYNLKNAWQVQMTPTFSYNHEARSGDELTFPVGVGVSKTVVWGKTPVKFNVQYWHYLESPDAFGADWQVRFNISPVVPLPW